MLMPLLLLQKPHRFSKAADHAACLRRRLAAWEDGDIDGLVSEARTIQHHLQHLWANVDQGKEEDRLARRFAVLLMQGKVHAALCLLLDVGRGGLLALDDHIDGLPDGTTVRDVLMREAPTWLCG